MSGDLVVRVKRLLSSARVPTRAHSGDSGLDLYAAESSLIPAGEVRTLRTGIALWLPPGTEGQIRSRSGLAHRYAVTVLNAPGTVDEGYRGELQVILINHGRRAFKVSEGMRIAQLVVQARLETKIVETESLPDSPRGTSGLGSTGE